ncbi:hypothetical protein V2J09_021191 [Rumex salicifolius]
MVVGFFRDIYSDFYPIVTPHNIFPVLEESRWSSPGPDGFQPIFHHQCWDLVGESVIREVRRFMASSNMPLGMNETFITLIPKASNPVKVNQFRPISLCNVSYKIITKIFTNRLQRILSNLVSPTQSGFLLGRLISDNIVLAQEVIHTLKRKQGKKGYMIMKIDLEKAYDRL